MTTESTRKRNVEICPIGFSDLADVVEVHMNAFGDSALTKLGRKAVLKYYQRQLSSAIKLYAIGAYIDGKMLGFSFGGLFGGAISDFLHRNRYFLFMQLLLRPWLLLNPVYLKKVLSGLVSMLRFSRKKGEVFEEPPVDMPEEFWILSIASATTARGLGVGRRLLEDSVQYARENDFDVLCLTVRPENINAVQFYEHIGLVKEGDLENWKGEMRKVLVHD